MQQITLLQVLRAAAALVVTFGHAQHDALVHGLKLGLGFERSFLLPWGVGVDLFFVISGFIMVHASERQFGRQGAGQAFLVRRIARIAPLYWLFLAAYMLLIVQAYRAGTRDMPALGDVLASFAFWPTDPFGDGIPRPLLTLGWTLNYEMFFYAAFALFIGLQRDRAVAGVALTLTGLVALGAVFEPTQPALFFWTRPIVLEFGLGMGLAILARRGVALRPIGRWALVAIGLAALAIDPLASSMQALDWTTPNDALRLVSWGVPAALIVAAAVLGPGGAPSRLTQAGIALGDASYALYLVHPFVIVGLRKLWLAAGLHAHLGLWLLVGATLVVSCVAALAIHRWVESPVTRWLQGRLAKPAPLRVASA